MNFITKIKTKSKVSQNKTNTGASPIYDIKINSLEGKEINLADLKGKKILFVNVASKCGFTEIKGYIDDYCFAM